MRLLLAIAAALSLAAPAAAQERVIYSSLPLQGDARPQSEDIVRAMRMALEDSGRTDIRHLSLDSATAEAGKWDPGQVFLNARMAVRDERTIAYLGEFNSGASAVSIPILNEAGILQISPSNTYVGLTRREGAHFGEPVKYYPTGVRTYGRVAPADHTQAHALLAYARERGRRRIAIVHDGEVYGKGLAELVEARARRHGVELVAVLRLGRRNRVAIARRIRALRADAMIYAGITQNGALPLWRSVHARNRRIDLFGSDGVAEEGFTRRVVRSARSRTFITSPALDPSAYPPAGQDFLRRFRERVGKEPASYAIFGYEAMALAIDALGRAADTPRGAFDALFATRDRASVLGTYSIDRHGDTTLSSYGGYRVSSGGRLVWNRVLTARP